MAEAEADQLGALGRLHRLFDDASIEYWLFGGWAVDLHVGAVTRPHGDLDVAIWREDYARASSPSLTTSADTARRCRSGIMLEGEAARLKP